VHDCCVIGAGAAGLSAARELSGAGRRVLVLEARPRIGGRVHTLHVPALPLPIELGAEFVHGDVETTFSIIESAALAAAELPDDHWWSRNGRWERIADFWGSIARVRAQIGTLKHDVSFEAFLRSRKSIPPRLRELACSFVEGYHASHADRISARVLRAADSEQEGTNRQFRLTGGYDAVVDWLHAGLDPSRVELRLSTVVTSIEWEEGRVTITTKSGQTFRAKAAVITIPVGVWKAARDQEGAIRFDPPLREKERALAKLESGHVVKIAFHFRERFWEGEGVEPHNFIHAADRYVPTWWTMAPLRAPILTAWAGGHAADALLAEGASAIVDRALDSMARAFSEQRSRLERLLVATWTHDWQADPFSRGAYSYAAVGGSNAHALLGRPIRKTLFFAGEATSGDQTGTVAGAIDSGRRAAKETLRSMA
jgi:monoamine oxidase